MPTKLGHSLHGTETVQHATYKFRVFCVSQTFVQKFHTWQAMSDGNDYLTGTICGSRILRIREPLGTQSPKPFPGTFLPENLEHFFLDLANLDSVSKVRNWFPPTPPPPPWTWEFKILANLDSASKVGN